jgi:lipopolysaccharide/colanic/teichoic acid biosynthesis glycosyltransferase
MHTKESELLKTTPVVRDLMHFRNAAVRQLYGEEIEHYIARFLDVGDESTEVLATSTVFNILAINGNSIRSIVNLKRFNDIENVNEFLAVVNQKLPYDGRYICCVESIEQRKQRILSKYPSIISHVYYVFDFMLKRVFPKWGPTRKIYKLLTRGNNRAISLTEALGRLRVSGFDIDAYAVVDNLTFIIVRKIAVPVQQAEQPYGVIVRLRRIGKDGKMFNVYKFRTMHPYAEFLQDYVYVQNNLANGGKFNVDFRITSWGRWMRKLWLDEQPMWINWLRGELKLVGVRPLSKQYFTLYPKEFRKRRIKYTPGLIPPFYVDMPETLDEIIVSEQRYLDAYDKHPWLTDMRYFCLSIYNIILKGKRSN